MSPDELAAVRCIRVWLGTRLITMARSEMSFSNGEIAQLIGAIDLVDDVIVKWEKLAIVRPATTKDTGQTDHIAQSVGSSKLGNPSIASECKTLSEGMMAASFSRGVESASCPRCGLKLIDGLCLRHGMVLPVTTFQSS